MDSCSEKLYYLSIALLVAFVQSNQVNADKYDDLFESIFNYGARQMSVQEIRKGLELLYKKRVQESSDASTSTGIHSRDPMKVEISFWRDAGDVDMSKCNHVSFRILESHFQRSRFIAGKLKDSGQPSRLETGVLNLEAYYKEILEKWVSFCAEELPNIYNKLQQATENNFEDVLTLSYTVWHTVRLSPYEIGRRVGDFLLSKADQDSIIQLSRSLDDLAQFKQVYHRYTPCTAILRVVQENEGFFEMLTKTRHYKLKDYRFPSSRSSDGEDNMQNWIDRISVCSFIEESQHVFAIAVDTMILKERMMKAIYEGTEIRDRGVFNNERYNWIFRFSSTPMSYIQVKSNLAILNFRKTGLRPQDERRNAVCFWLHAVTHHVSKCNDEDDQIMLLNLEYDKARANEAELVERPFERGGFFNLETFVHEVRLQRLRYCEFSIGLFFVNRVEKWRNTNKKGYDLRALTEGLFHMEGMNPNVLGKRVADLIIRRSHQGSLTRIRQSSHNTDWIARQYHKYSPCFGLLAIAERYSRFLRLVTAPGMYEHTKPSLRHWIDKVTVCRSIEQHSGLVFNAASLHLDARRQPQIV